jgi:hypothetical protein
LEHQLQPVPIGVVEIDAAIIARATADRNAMSLQFGLEALVGSRCDVEREVVHVPTASARFLLEQGNTLVPGMKEHLALAFAVNGHAQDAGVEIPGTRHIGDMQDDMVDPAGFDYRSALAWRE